MITTRLCFRNKNKQTGEETPFVEVDYNFKNDRWRIYYRIPTRIKRDYLIGREISKKIKGHKIIQEKINKAFATIETALSEIKYAHHKVYNKSQFLVALRGEEINRMCISEAIGIFLEENTNLKTKNIDKFKNLRTRINDFQEGKNYLISNIDQKWINGFEKHLCSFQQPSTISKTFDHMITVLHYLLKKGIISDSFKKLSYPNSSEKKDMVTFSSSEILIIASLQGLTKEQERKRDMILFQCYSGLRYEDAFNIQPYMVTNNGELLEVPTNKTKVTVYIPLHAKLKDVLEKYGYDTTKIKISNQKYNKGIKQILEKCGFTEEVKQIKYKDGKKIEIIVPRFQLSGSHTFRRSFITNALANGIPQSQLQFITGHQSLRMLAAYNHLQKSELISLTSKFDQQ